MPRHHVRRETRVAATERPSIWTEHLEVAAVSWAGRTGIVDKGVAGAAAESNNYWPE